MITLVKPYLAGRVWRELRSGVSSDLFSRTYKKWFAIVFRARRATKNDIGVIAVSDS